MNSAWRYVLVLACLCAGTGVPAIAQSKKLAKKLDTARIDQITGSKGTMNDAEGVFKVSFPRDDVKVTVDGVAMPPFMGLTSWAAFKPGMAAEAMVMGDIVLFQDEVNPAMDAAFASGSS